MYIFKGLDWLWLVSGRIQVSMFEFLVFASILTVCSAQELIVQLPNGKVQGTTLSTPSGRQFYTWRHIPYAKPPLGKLRFQPPVKPDSWAGVLDGSKDSEACLFVGSFKGNITTTFGHSEDCLYVNVYSPIKPDSNLRLPVMFWIYGGGFFIGSSHFSLHDPTPFLEEDVIVVSFNYRLSIFGFLSTEDEVLPGNGALKDQHAALVWTKENIAFFGGNPLDITVFGESAGAMAIGYHLVSLMSRDLFSAAILQSGTSLIYYLQTNARNNALSLAQQVDSSITPSSSSVEILNALQLADADLLVNLTLAQRIMFTPVLEVNSLAPFMTQPFYEALEAGNGSRVPIIIGINSEELIHYFPDKATGLHLAKSYDGNSSLLLPKFKIKNGTNIDAIAREIKHAYVGNGTFVGDLGGLVRWMSDNSFVRPAIKHAVLQSKHTPVYFYKFSFVGTPSLNHPEIPGCGRVGHAEDSPYLFNISVWPIKTDADYLTRRRLVKLWTNFVKTKNPTPHANLCELLRNVTWNRFDDNMQYLDIDENLELKYNLKAKVTSFWDHLWDTYSYRPYITF